MSDLKIAWHGAINDRARRPRKNLQSTKYLRIFHDSDECIGYCSSCSIEHDWTLYKCHGTLDTYGRLRSHEDFHLRCNAPLYKAYCQEGDKAPTHHCIPPVSVIRFGDNIVVSREYRAAMFKHCKLYTTEEVVGCVFGEDPDFPSYKKFQEDQVGVPEIGDLGNITDPLNRRALSECCSTEINSRKRKKRLGTSRDFEGTAKRVRLQRENVDLTGRDDTGTGGGQETPNYLEVLEESAQFARSRIREHEVRRDLLESLGRKIIRSVEDVRKDNTPGINAWLADKTFFEDFLFEEDALVQEYITQKNIADGLDTECHKMRGTAWEPSYCWHDLVGCVFEIETYLLGYKDEFGMPFFFGKLDVDNHPSCKREYDKHAAETGCFVWQQKPRSDEHPDDKQKREEIRKMSNEKHKNDGFTIFYVNWD